MISIEGKRQDQDTLVLKANNRKTDITPNDYCIRQVSWTKRCWPSQSACCIITYTVHPGLDVVGNKVIIIIGLVSWIQSCHLFSFGHYASSAWCIMRYTVYPDLVSCPFYAIPIYPL